MSTRRVYVTLLRNGGLAFEKKKKKQPHLPCTEVWLNILKPLLQLNTGNLQLSRTAGEI